MKRIFCEILKFLRIFIMDFYEFFINFCRVFFKFSLENVAFYNDKQKMCANFAKLTKTATNTTPKKP